MLPVGSILANLIMVDLAMLLMVLTVLGVILHLLSASVLARPLFVIVGALSEFLTMVAEKIGMAEWSTVSVSHKYFERFLVVMLVGIGLVFVARRYNKNIVKHTAIVLSALFVLITCYTVSYDYNNSCVEILFTDEKPVIIVKSGDTSLLVGTPKNKYFSSLKQMMNAHNEKQLDGIVVTDNDNGVVSRLLSVYDSFNIAPTNFCESGSKVFESLSVDFVDEITVNGKVRIDLQNPEKYIGISTKNKRMIFIECEDEENIFEITEMYDIIILYGKKSMESFDTMKQDNPQSEIIVSDVNKKVTIYIE